MNIKKFMQKFLIAFVFLFFSFSFAYAEKKAELIIDAKTGNILHQLNAYDKRYPASLTKIMTLYMLYEAVEQGKLTPESTMAVSRYATAMSPSKLNLRAGSSIKVKDAIMALVTKSANDVAVVVAEKLGGTESNFATMMTKKAKLLGMRNTVFRNASGLPNSRQYTTAHDMGVLAIQMMNNFPQYYSLFSAKSFYYNGVTHTSHNNLLGRYLYKGCDGIKTGFINASGFNLVTSAQKENDRVIGVIFGGTTAANRDLRMKALLDDGFRKIETGVKVSTIGMNVQHNLALMKNIDPFQPQRQYASAVNTTNSLVGNTRYVTPKMLAPRQKTKTGSLVPLDEDNSDIKEIIQVNNNNNINKHDDDNYLEITSKPVQDDNFNNHLPQKPQYRNTTTSNTHIANTNIDDTKNFDKIEYRTADGSIYIPQIKKEAKQTKVASLNFDTHTDNISIPQSYTRKGVWSVQVGAFSGKKAAYQYISTLKNKYNKQLSGGKEMVVAFNSGKSIFYRARFEGYTPNKAQSICSFLVSERKKCVALKGVN